MTPTTKALLDAMREISKECEADRIAGTYNGLETAAVVIAVDGMQEAPPKDRGVILKTVLAVHNDAQKRGFPLQTKKPVLTAVQQDGQDGPSPNGKRAAASH